MARLKDLTQITGALGNLSFYTRHDSDKVIVRTKGGASKENIKNSQAFVNLRKHNLEFGGVASMCKNVRLTFRGMQQLADHNLAPSLNKVMRTIQSCDTERPKGERAILLSQYPHLLRHYEFNRKQSLSNMWRVPYVLQTLREQQQANVEIPAFDSRTALNINHGAIKNQHFTHFRILLTLGIATDMHFDQQNKRYQCVHEAIGQGFDLQSSDWYAAQYKVPAHSFVLQLVAPNDNAPYQLQQADSLILCVAIELGFVNAKGEMEAIRNMGGGLIADVF